MLRSLVSRLVRRGDLAALALTLTLVGLSWCVTYRVYSPTTLTQPIEYWLDAMYQQGAVKSYGDRALSSLVGGVNPWLGAPLGAHWADFPTSEDVVFLGVGLLGRLTSTITAMNLAFLGSLLLAAATMFLVARRLRIPAPLAALAGALFGGSPFIHYRNIQHFNLIVYWHLPLCILGWVWLSAKKAPGLKTKRFAALCGIAVLTGFHNNYFTNYFMQVLLLIAVLHAAAKRWASMRATLLTMVAGMFAFFLANLDTLVFVAQNGRNQGAVARNIGETLIYGLRPLELFVPGNLHRIDAFARGGASYLAHSPVVGEFPSNYLGVLPAFAFVALITAGLGALMTGAKRGSHTRFTVFSIWLVFVAMGGGLMQLSQMILGFVAFRSNNRVSILLMGLGLLFAGRVLSRRFRSMPRWGGWAVAVPLIIAGLWEQSPDQSKKVVYPGGRNHWAIREVWAKSAASDEKLTLALENALPEGAAVLQLPVQLFPESGGGNGQLDYDPLRLYLNSHRKLRFSYAGMKGRPEGEWATKLTQLPPRQLLATIRESNFRAITIASRSFPATSIDQLAQEMETFAPTTKIISDDGDWIALLWGG